MSGLRGIAIPQIGENDTVINVDRSKSKRPGWQVIIISSSWLILPLTILTVALITYVYKHQVPHGNATPSVFEQESPDVPDDGAIYVQVDSTMLVFLASWMSSVAPLLISFAIGLTTFPVTKQLLRDTRESARSGDLPTSSQLHLMMKLINGATFTGIWGLLRYRIKWRRRADGRSTALLSLMSVTIASILLRYVHTKSYPYTD